MVLEDLAVARVTEVDEIIKRSSFNGRTRSFI